MRADEMVWYILYHLGVSSHSGHWGKIKLASKIQGTRLRWGMYSDGGYEHTLELSDLPVYEKVPKRERTSCIDTSSYWKSRVRAGARVKPKDKDATANRPEC